MRSPYPQAFPENRMVAVIVPPPPPTGTRQSGCAVGQRFFLDLSFFGLPSEWHGGSKFSCAPVLSADNIRPSRSLLAVRYCLMSSKIPSGPAASLSLRAAMAYSSRFVRMPLRCPWHPAMVL
eukprot:RCo003709